MTDYPTNLSYACVDAQPIDYEFSGERWAECTSDGSGWRVCWGSILPGDQETEIKDGDRTLELDRQTFAIGVTTPFTDDDGDEDEEWEEVDPSEHEKYDELADKFGLDGDEVRRHIDGDDHDEWMPMMNYAYPLPDEPPEDWKAHVVTCTCVEIDGNYYLALTGGGMDLSWQICESYMRLGYFPPAHFADLPQICGRGTSELDRWIIDGCRKSLQAVGARARHACDRLDELIDWAARRAAEREAATASKENAR